MPDKKKFVYSFGAVRPTAMPGCASFSAEKAPACMK